MSSNTQNQMSAAPSKSAPKKSKATVVTEPVAVVAPVAPAKKAVKKAEATAVTAPSPSAPTAPAVTAQPVATEAPAVEEKSWQEELRSVVDQLTAVRDAAVAGLAAAKRLERRFGREMKDAKKGKRKQRVLAEGEEAKPSIFSIPVPITDELSLFLGGGKGNKMSRSQVTKAISAYVKQNQLNDKHKINPNAALRKLLGLKEGDELTIFNLQSYLQKHYVKPAATA